MSVKVFSVNVDLDIQAVTCPGVWLCPNGGVTLKVHIFDNIVRTFSLEPVFPLLYHQKLIFHKTFRNVRNLADLQQLLGQETLYAELIQCTGCQGTVLATFESSLFELLYPSPCVKTLIAGVDVNLLMEPTKFFPGILAPKIEVSTKTTIDELLSSPPPCKRDPGLINPKMLSSKGPTSSKTSRRNKVSHRKKTSRSPTPTRDCYSPKSRCRSVDSSPRCDYASCNCRLHHQFEGASCRCLSSRETLKKYSSDQHCVWNSVSGKSKRSPRSCCDILNDDVGKKKHRKWKTDECSCHAKEDYYHKVCTCKVCRTYASYFDENSTCGCPSQHVNFKI